MSLLEIFCDVDDFMLIFDKWLKLLVHLIANKNSLVDVKHQHQTEQCGDRCDGGLGQSPVAGTGVGGQRSVGTSRVRIVYLSEQIETMSHHLVQMDQSGGYF